MNRKLTTYLAHAKIMMKRNQLLSTLCFMINISINGFILKNLDLMKPLSCLENFYTTDIKIIELKNHIADYLTMNMFNTQNKPSTSILTIEVKRNTACIEFKECGIGHVYNILIWKHSSRGH
jgi:hypothetical protein